MDIVTVFKVAQLLVLVVFAIFASDIRSKSGATPLLSKHLIVYLKLSYLIPICIYGYTLVRLQSVKGFDYVAFALIGTGTFLVIKAKLDLGSLHTWTGYGLPETRLLTRGIYAWMRHPLYTGIYLVIAGGATTTMPRVGIYAQIVFFATLIYITGFLRVAAVRESNLLSSRFGIEFVRYRTEVYSCVPIRRYRSREEHEHVKAAAASSGSI